MISIYADLINFIGKCICKKKISKILNLLKNKFYIFLKKVKSKDLNYLGV